MDDMLLIIVALFTIIGVYLAALWAIARDLRRQTVECCSERGG